ncbi:hypothetical protein ASD78_13705 [Lysobacter sp. Root667]|uniref:hypothetical protein n=1 Tax=Lysobacter sp. Root667 TaxID=1736581 RepID=UPI0006F90859|nr:hypothetical protein [Lysobacter sp. Root667]KRA74514.1 hypothetical protein ASD78_13705 [Lysobacter sp. Root667]
MTPRIFKWAIFASLILSVPLLFFLGMAAGFFPMLVIAAISLASLGTDPFLSIIGLVYVVAYGALLYGIALGASKLAGRLSGGLRLVLAIGIVSALAWTTFQPWYGWGGYATSRYYPLPVIVRKALSPERA